MDAVLNILRTLVTDIRRTIDDGATTLAQINSHIAVTDRLLRGMIVLLSTEHAVPLMETALRSMQQVLNTLISIAAHLIDTRTGHGFVGYYPEVSTMRFEGGRGRHYSRGFSVLFGSWIFGYNNSHVVTRIS